MKGEGFLTRNISGFTQAMESVVASEKTCRTPGLLQGLDSRVKVISFVLFIVMVGLARSLEILGIIFLLIILLSFLSRIAPGYFLKRVLLFIPVFTLVIAIPALFITPGTPLVNIGTRVIITQQGARTAAMLFLRVTDSLSFGILLILTTSWTNVLAALRWLRLPALVVDVLGMTYRYIFLLLHNTNSMFPARRSRTIGGFTGSENRRWLTSALTATMAKTQHLSEEVYLAMLSRGYQGEVKVLNNMTIRRRDIIWIGFVFISLVVLFWSNHLWN